MVKPAASKRFSTLPTWRWAMQSGLKITNVLCIGAGHHTFQGRFGKPGFEESLRPVGTRLLESRERGFSRFAMVYNRLRIRAAEDEVRLGKHIHGRIPWLMDEFHR